METTLNVVDRLISMVEAHGMSAIMIIVLGIMVYLFIRILGFLTEQGKLHNQNYTDLSTNITKNTAVTSEMNDYLHKRNGTLDAQLKILCDSLEKIEEYGKKK